jgi:hypothetical protein
MWWVYFISFLTASINFDTKIAKFNPGLLIIFYQFYTVSSLSHHTTFRSVNALITLKNNKIYTLSIIIIVILNR